MCLQYDWTYVNVMAELSCMSLKRKLYRHCSVWPQLQQHYSKILSQVFFNLWSLLATPFKYVSYVKNTWVKMRKCTEIVQRNSSGCVLVLHINRTFNNASSHFSANCSTWCIFLFVWLSCRTQSFSTPTPWPQSLPHPKKEVPELTRVTPASVMWPGNQHLEVGWQWRQECSNIVWTPQKTTVYMLFRYEDVLH